MLGKINGLKVPITHTNTVINTEFGTDAADRARQFRKEWDEWILKAEKSHDKQVTKVLEEKGLQMEIEEAPDRLQRIISEMKSKPKDHIGDHLPEIEICDLQNALNEPSDCSANKAIVEGGFYLHGKTLVRVKEVDYEKECVHCDTLVTHIVHEYWIPLARFKEQFVLWHPQNSFYYPGSKFLDRKQIPSGPYPVWIFRGFIEPDTYAQRTAPFKTAVLECASQWGLYRTCEKTDLPKNYLLLPDGF